jgi:CheY-like chemotaxis protein
MRNPAKAKKPNIFINHSNKMNVNRENAGPFIFLAEDDVDDQELLIEALTNLDNTITIETANNGKKAIHFLEAQDKDQTPTLIILDFNLPELSGAEILKHLNSLDQYKDVPKIVWSTSNSPVYEKICLHLGASAYMVKPHDVSGISRIAQRMVQIVRGEVETSNRQ